MDGKRPASDRDAPTIEWMPAAMHLTRTLDCPFAPTATLMRFSGDGFFPALPDNLWDIVIFRRNESVSVLRTGLTTRPDMVPYQAGDEILVVSFPPQCFMPTMPGEQMRDDAFFLDRFGRSSVRIGPCFHEIPTWDTVDAFVARLLATEVVEAAQSSIPF